MDDSFFAILEEHSPNEALFLDFVAKIEVKTCDANFSFQFNFHFTCFTAQGRSLFLYF